MTGGGQQHFQSMDAHDLANLHVMNVRYLQAVATQRGMQQQRPSGMAPPSASVFSAKM